MLISEYIRKYVVKRVDSLSNPKVFPITEFELAQHSVVHYLPKTTSEYGIEPKDLLLLGVEDEVLIHHVLGYSKEYGNFRDTGVNVGTLERDYHRRFRKLRRLRKLETGLKNKNRLTTVNYALLQHIKKQTVHQLNRFFMWQTLTETFINTVNEVSGLSSRPQFVEIPLPKVIPTLEELKRVEKQGLVRESLDELPDVGSLYMADIWLWLKGEKTLSNLEDLSPLAVNQLNLVFVVDTKWVVISVQNLKEWREADGDKAAREFIRFMESLSEHRTELNDGDEAIDLLDDDNQPSALEDNKTQLDVKMTKNVIAIADRLGDAGQLSTAEYRRVIRNASRYKKIPNPVGEGTLEDILEVKPSEMTLEPATIMPDTDTIVDKSMLQSRLKNFDDYASTVLPKHMAQTVMALQNVGITVADYKVERVIDAVSDYDAYTIKLIPISGVPSTIRFKLPRVQKDGTFITNGTKARMPKQRCDIPIRKAGDNKVALTSYYGKVFVFRSPKVTNDRGNWLANTFITDSLSDNPTVTDLNLSDVFNKDLELPRDYTSIAKRTSGFKSGSWAFNFDYSKREEFFGADVVKKLEAGDRVLVAKGSKGNFVIDKENNWLYVDKEGKELYVPNIFSALEIKHKKEPVDIVDVKILGKYIPVGFVLGYRLGLTKLLNSLKVDFTLVPRGSRTGDLMGKGVIQFKDVSLVYSKEDQKSSMIISSLASYHKALKEYDFHEFDNQDVYFNVLDKHELGIRYLKEIDSLFDLFVDPITESYLRKMKEPTSFQGLLVRSAELLVTDQHPAESDTDFMRFRGYERFAGAVYGELVKSVREYRSKPVTSRASVELNPKAVWLEIVQDPSIRLVEESTPIHNTKMKEQVTYSGKGGRDPSTMVRRTRSYHEKDRGIISEATPDSAKVAIDTFTSPDPAFADLFGTRNEEDISSPTKNISTSALITPGAMMDSAKRINFISIQNSGGVWAEGYKTMPLRTGYEQVLAHRVDKLFASTTEMAGRVIEKDDETITVEYDNGETETWELGNQFGFAAGITNKQVIVSSFEVGDRVGAGSVIAYNQGYFEEDWMNPGQVTYKSGVMARTALMDVALTLEDSSAISKELAAQLRAPTTKVRSLVVDFKKAIHGLLEVGDVVESDSILCTLEDEFSVDAKLFDDKTIASLQELQSGTPFAKSKGTIEKIEVVYFGDKEDMSDSLKKVVNKYDRLRAKRVTKMGSEEAKTGRISESIYIDGKLLTPDNVSIKIYISSMQDMSVGDKPYSALSLKLSLVAFLKARTQPKTVDRLTLSLARTR